MSEGSTFPYSGLPNFIEWYKCYDDPSVDQWIDGMEIVRERAGWDQKSIDRWNFLYRPYHGAVGRPQKKRVRELRRAIDACRSNIAQANGYLASLAEDRRRQVHGALAIAIMGALAGVVLWFYEQSALAAALSILIALVLIPKTLAERRENRSHVERLETNVRQNEEVVRGNEEGIRLLEDEIRQLVRMIPETFDAATVNSWFLEEVREMELVCLGEILNESVTSETIKRYFRRSFGDPRVETILIDSWGCLQALVQSGPLGRESTGLGRAYLELGDRASTWQVGQKGSPFFRLWYLQYVMPMARNLNICSFFYDFVTRRCYGRRWEVFQYNHVATMSLREIDPKSESWTGRGPSPWSDSKAEYPKALTIATSSGVHFRCILVDEDLAGYFADHLRCDERFASSWTISHERIPYHRSYMPTVTNAAGRLPKRRRESKPRSPHGWNSDGRSNLRRRSHLVHC